MAITNLRVSPRTAEKIRLLGADITRGINGVKSVSIDDAVDAALTVAAAHLKETIDAFNLSGDTK
jgi:hypothetical protein